ncbi:hypothetical protein HG530_013446 [Fusarium avenaceum]|nr:hypothetical protein HG530_013446 [Fusarium avenaceum]
MRRPTAASTLAANCHNHVIVDDSRAVKYIVIQLIPEVGFVVSVSEPWGKCDVVVVSVLVYHQKQCSGHVLASKTNGTPRSVYLDTETEVNFGVEVVANVDGECYVAIWGDKCGLANIIFVFREGDRKQSYQVKKVLCQW